jgi:transposase-like protein
MKRVTLGKSRVREIRPPGSVRAKAKWLSYSTTTIGMGLNVEHRQHKGLNNRAEKTGRRMRICRR